MDFETRAIHEGQEPDPATGAITTPIYLTSTYVQDAVGEHKGYDYSRVANPTRTALQQCLASLESAEHGVAFASGLGATTTIMHLLSPGDRMVLIADVYGGVYRMTSQVYEPKGYVFDYLPAAEFDDLSSHLDERTRIVWIETPSNPLLNIVDIKKAADAAHAAGALLVVDNTFATPYLQRPLELGADIVVHSTTKYLGGHSDVVGGAAIVRDPQLHEKVKFVQNAVGAVPGPFDCFLVHRGLRTLHLRVAAHDANGLAVSSWLREQAGIEDVRWPGFGGMVSFRHPDAVRIASSTRVFSLAESLGGVESLIEVPQAMTHQSVEGSAAAVPPDLVRLSCGIEASVDLIEDLAQALQGRLLSA